MNAFQRARDRSHAPGKTLVIIDMQSGFMGEDEEVGDIVPIICSLIYHAKQNEWAIIVVEFEGNGKTDEAILESLVGYPHWTTLYKVRCDGGIQVVRCINEHPTWSLNTLVCGIYGPQCVADTIRGMFDASNLVEVAVVADAVYPDYRSCTKKLDHGVFQEAEVQTVDVVGCNSPVSI